MATYHYKGHTTAKYSPGGNAKGLFKSERTTGVLTFEGTPSEAARRLEEQGIAVSALPKEVDSATPFSRFVRTKPEHQLRFFESMAFLSKTPINTALHVCISRCADKKYATALRAVAAEVSSGTEIDVAMQKRPRDFTPLQVAMVRAGREAGAAEETYVNLAEMLDTDFETANVVRDALMGPAWLGLLAIAAIIFMFTFFVPRMQQLLGIINRPLPPITLLVIGLSHFATNPWTWVFGLSALVGGYMWWRNGMREASFAVAWDRLILKIPVIGQLLEKSATARISRTLSVLIRTVSPAKAVSLLVPLARTTRHRMALEEAAEQIREGATLARAFERTGAFDPMFVSYLDIGDQSTELSAACRTVAIFLEREVSRTTKKLTKAIEPTFTLVLSTAFTIIFFALYLPYFDFIGNIGS